MGMLTLLPNCNKAESLFLTNKINTLNFVFCENYIYLQRKC